MASREKPKTRAHYPRFSSIETRWMDNDVYGHVNNVVYYSFFDTIINRYLIAEGGLDIHAGAIIGLAVETACAFHGSVQFPDVLEAGLRVAHLGSSSVRYEVGIFVTGEDTARADGRFTHVFVDRETRRPTPIPEKLRAALARIHVEEVRS
jgi:acyl-CoA thioester hydrolase